VAGRRDPLFTEGALRALFAYSKGVPREICRLGLTLLPAALQAGVQRIGEDLVQRLAEASRSPGDGRSGGAPRPDAGAAMFAGS